MFVRLFAGKQHHQRTVFPADSGRAHLSGAQTGQAAVGQGQEGSGAGAVHWQPAGAHHGRQSEHPHVAELSEEGRLSRPTAGTLSSEIPCSHNHSLVLSFWDLFFNKMLHKLHISEFQFEPHISFLEYSWFWMLQYWHDALLQMYLYKCWMFLLAWQIWSLLRYDLSLMSKSAHLIPRRFPAACRLEKPSRMKKSLNLLLLPNEHECGFLLLYWKFFIMIVLTAKRHFTQLTLFTCTLYWCSTLYCSIKTGQIKMRCYKQKSITSTTFLYLFEKRPVCLGIKVLGNMWILVICGE